MSHSLRDAALERLRRRQRALFVLALVVAMVIAALTVASDEPAVAASECGPGDQYRNDLSLGASDNSVQPCISGTNLALTVPRDCVGTVCDTKYRVSEIRRHGQETVRYSDGSSEKLWHFTFKELNFRRDVSMRTDNNDAGQLSIDPSGPAHIGGTDDAGTAMYTDVWVSSGTFNITFTDLPSPLLCTVDIPEDSPLVEVVQGGTIRGCGLDLDVKYLVSYDATSGADGGAPVRLPNTKLEVTE